MQVRHPPLVAEFCDVHDLILWLNAGKKGRIRRLRMISAVQFEVGHTGVWASHNWPVPTLRLNEVRERSTAELRHYFRLVGPVSARPGYGGVPDTMVVRIEVGDVIW